MKPRLKSIDRMLRSALATSPLRAGSFIVTVFGDAISQHGNAVWLGSLIQVFEPFGLNARQIRTAVFRLVQDDWLSCEKMGRRSFYSFTEFGLRQYAKSAQRIYAAQQLAWDGQWTLVLPVYVAAEDRERVKRELVWLGFGNIGNGVMAHPRANQQALVETLQDLGVENSVVTLTTADANVLENDVLQRITRERWELDKLELRYENYIEKFSDIADSLETEDQLDTRQMFELQTLMIHEYRRILLISTDLPDELLPPNWPGRIAMDLTRRIYGITLVATAAYLEDKLEGPNGRVAAAEREYFERFNEEGGDKIPPRLTASNAN